MYKQVEKPKENKSRAVDNSVAQKKSYVRQGFGFVDNHPVAIAQRKLQDLANISPKDRQTVQLKSIEDNRSVQGHPPEILGRVIQKKENKTGLPDNLKSGIENLSGNSMDDVKVHYNSDKPAQLHAHAYAQGTDIHLASGQEKHLPHEAWHVVQQKQGRVKPSMQMKGAKINDHVGLEKEADMMGAKGIQLQVAQEIPVLVSQEKISSDVYQLFSEDEITLNTYSAELKDVLVMYQTLNDKLRVTYEVNEAFFTMPAKKRTALVNLKVSLMTFFKSVGFNPEEVLITNLVPALQDHLGSWKEGFLKEKAGDDRLREKAAKVAEYEKAIATNGFGHEQSDRKDGPIFKSSLSVAQGWYTIARLNGDDAGLLTLGAAPCVVIGMSDPSTQIVLLAHVDSATKPEQCQPLIDFLVQRIQYHIMTQGVGDGKKVDGYLSGGNNAEAYMELFYPLSQGMKKNPVLNIMHLHSTAISQDAIDQQMGRNVDGQRDYSSRIQ